MTARQETAALKRRIRLLERDRMFARSLLLPGQVAVYKAAIKWFESYSRNERSWPLMHKVFEACARARKGTK